MQKLVCCIAGVACVAGAAWGEPAGDGAAAYHESVSERTQRLMAEYQSRRAERNRDRAEDMHMFEASDGRVILTNLGHRYRNRQGYTELKVDFDPITVPNRFKNHSIAEYTSSDIAGLVKNYARRYGLEEALVYAVIRAESNFNPNAVSTAGARGLMQLMPGTAKEMGVTRIHDPAQNIAGGTQYLSKCLQIFDGDVKLALAAYNAGPQAVKNHGGIPPYKETQNYVKIVERFYQEYKGGRVNPVLLARAGQAPKTQQPTRLTSIPRSAKRDATDRVYNVHYKSGLIQPADNIEELNDEYYILRYQGHAWTARKDLIKEIIEPA